MFTVHVRMLIIQQLTICTFHFLLSIHKMKENNQHNKLLNEHRMMLNLYSPISLSDKLQMPLWLHCIVIFKLKGNAIGTNVKKFKI